MSVRRRLHLVGTRLSQLQGRLLRLTLQVWMQLKCRFHLRAIRKWNQTWIQIISTKNFRQDPSPTNSWSKC